MFLKVVAVAPRVLMVILEKLVGLELPTMAQMVMGLMMSTPCESEEDLAMLPKMKRTSMVRLATPPFARGAPTVCKVGGGAWRIVNRIIEKMQYRSSVGTMGLLVPKVLGPEVVQVTPVLNPMMKILQMALVKARFCA